MRALRPAPEPSGEYWILAPELADSKPAFQASMAAEMELAPVPVKVPVTAAPVLAPVVAPLPVATTLSVPQAVSAKCADGEYCCHAANVKCLHAITSSMGCFRFITL